MSATETLLAIAAFVILLGAQVFWNVRCASRREEDADSKIRWRGGWRSGS